jgi:ApaG protein
MSRYEAITRNIQVVVEPTYLTEQSEPDQEYYVWAYRVEIENKGAETVQLQARYWRITDAFGRTQEVRGHGVVGEQPVLRPGEKFEYTSGTPLNAPSGLMSGNYQMQTTGGDLFEAEIPLFSLDSPHDIRRVH